MLSWNQIPLERIAFHINVNNSRISSKKDLTQCSLTCKRWRDFMQLTLFSEIYLRSTDDDIENFHHLLQVNNSRLKYWVKIIYINADLNRNVLFRIDNTFPCLEEVASLKCNNQPNFFFLYKSIIEDRLFKSLKIIPYSPNIREQDLLYFDCLDYMKDCLTTVALSDSDRERSIRAYPSLRNKPLNYFPNLKKVSLRVENNHDIEPNSVIEYLESLTRLNTKSLQDVSLSVDHNFGRFIFSAATVPDTIQPVNNVKQLRLYLCSTYTIPAPSNEFLVYIIKNFPKLISLNICNVKECGEEGDTGVLSDYFPTAFDNMSQTADSHQFLKYLCKIPTNSTTNVIIFNENTAQLIQDLQADDNVKSITASHYLKMKYKLGNEDTISACIDIEPTNKVYSNTRKVEVVFDKYNALYEQHQLALIKQVGHYFDIMCLKVATNNVLILLLGFIGIKCTRLYGLAISKDSFFDDLFL